MPAASGPSRAPWWRPGRQRDAAAAAGTAVGSIASPGEPRIVVIGRDGCHLCDDAHEVVAAVAVERGISWRAADLGEDPQWQAAYVYEIPVVLVDGVDIAHHRVTPDQLKAALRKRR